MAGPVGVQVGRVEGRAREPDVGTVDGPRRHRGVKVTDGGDRLTVEVHVDNTLTDLAAGRFDAGIRIGELVGKDMVAVRIGPELRMAVVGSPSYFAARGKPKHPRDLHQHDCITYRQRSSGVVYRWEFTEHDKDFAVAMAAAG